MKYSLSSREIPRACPWDFPKGSGYISLYILTQVTIQTFSITTPALNSWDINIGRVDSPYCSDSWAIQENITRRLSNTVFENVLYCIVLYCIVLYCIVLYCVRVRVRVRFRVRFRVRVKGMVMIRGRINVFCL